MSRFSSRAGVAAAFALLTACAASRPAEKSPAATPPSATKADPLTDAPTVYRWEGTEIFGSRKLPKERLLAMFDTPAPGTVIDMAKTDLPKRLGAARDKLMAEDAIALCKFNFVGYPPKHTMRLTVDLVDKGDEWRMKFTPAPTGTVPDPAGLIASWDEYKRVWWKLRNTGAIPMNGEEGQCRAFVCFGGFAHPELAGYEQRFVDGVPAHVDELVRVLREDKDQGKRMTAIRLLSYLPSREKVVSLVLPFVRDEQQGVRNEVLRMLGGAQHGAREVIIPLDVVLDSLWLPESTDRNKAGWALVRIVETEGAAHADPIAAQAGEVLVSMVGMQQDIDREPALKVLQIISGKNLGPDQQAWRGWLEGKLGHPVQLLSGVR